MPPKAQSPTRTLILLKPDAIERGLVGEIFKRFERKGFKIIKAEMRWADEDLAKKHYAEHAMNKIHYKSMVDAITRGPVMAVILEGLHAVEASRQLIGSASPLHHSSVGTIRADLSIQEPDNLVHGSDSHSAAIREITLWFSKELSKPGTGLAPKSSKLLDAIGKPAQDIPKVGVKKNGKIMFPPKKKPLDKIPPYSWNNEAGDDDVTVTLDDLSHAKNELIKMVTTWSSANNPYAQYIPEIKTATP